MSENRKPDQDKTPLSAELIGGVFSIVNTALEMGVTVTKSAAEITASGKPIQPPDHTGDPMNQMLHYGVTTVSNVVRLVLPDNTPPEPAPQPPEAAAPPPAATPTRSRPTTRPGGTLRIPLMIENPHAEPQTMRFQCLSVVTDTLATGTALRIEHVRCDPAELTVQPADFEKLTVYIDAPDDAAVGTYEVVIGLPEGGFELKLPVVIASGE